jgi:salicylate hydroxylase
MAQSPQMRVAIVGGGLAGATLMNALLKHPHLDVDIFESAPEFSERGAAVGLAQNAQSALSEIGQSVAECLDKAGAVQMNSSRLVIVSIIFTSTGLGGRSHGNSER